MKTIIKYELVINEALRSALTYDTPDEQINEFISFFGRHIGSDRIYIFEDRKDTNTTDNTYEWCNDGVTPEIDNLQGVPMELIQWWYDAFDKGESVIIHDLEDIKDEHPDSYEILSPQHINRLAVCPFRYKNSISGFFGVDNPPEGDRLGLTTFLDMISTLLISFLKMRNTYNRSRRAATFSGYSALAQIYISMHYVNVKTNQFHIIKTTDDILRMLGRETLDEEKYDVEENFGAHIEQVLRRFCKKDYLQKELEFVNVETVEDRLKGRNSIVNEFYGKVSGWCRDRFIPVDYDEEGRLFHVLYCVESIDEQKERENQLLYMAQTDLMTGICNRGSGEKLIEEALNNKQKGMMCLIDCDKFKSINDTYGHAVGDAVIIAIANTLKKPCRDNDIVMRLGGDEFAMFISDVTDEEEAESLFEELFKNVGQIRIKELGDRQIVISLGACVYDGIEDIDFDELYYRADMAMYQSKKHHGFYATMYGEI